MVGSGFSAFYSDISREESLYSPPPSSRVATYQANDIYEDLCSLRSRLRAEVVLTPRRAERVH